MENGNPECQLGDIARRCAKTTSGYIQIGKRNAPGLVAENHGTQLGFIAQDFRDAVPRNLSKSVVTQIGNEDFLGITSNSMTPLLTGAVQEQQLTIKNLQTLVEELQDRVEKLELRVSSLS